MGFNRRLAGTLEDEVRWLLNARCSCQVQKDGMRLMFAVYIYWVWRSRNDKIYSGIAHTVNNLFVQIRDEVRIKLQSNNYRMEEGPERSDMENTWGITIPTKELIVQRVKWCKPMVGRWKLNTDGSMRNGNGFWGAAIRDSEGKVCRAMHGVSPMKCIDEVELDALEQGLEIACKYGYNRLIINMDSAIALHYVKMARPPWQLRGRVRRINIMMESLQECILEHCYRELNSLADELASYDTGARLVELNVNELSTKCNVIIESDMRGLLYERV